MITIAAPDYKNASGTRKILELAPDLPVIGLTAHALPVECRAVWLQVCGSVSGILVKFIRENLPDKPQISLHEGRP